MYIRKWFTSIKTKKDGYNEKYNDKVAYKPSLNVSKNAFSWDWGTRNVKVLSDDEISISCKTETSVSITYKSEPSVSFASIGTNSQSYSFRYIQQRAAYRKYMKDIRLMFETEENYLEMVDQTDRDMGKPAWFSAEKQALYGSYKCTPCDNSEFSSLVADFSRDEYLPMVDVTDFTYDSKYSDMVYVGLISTVVENNLVYNPITLCELLANFNESIQYIVNEELICDLNLSLLDQMNNELLREFYRNKFTLDNAETKSTNAWTEAVNAETKSTNAWTEAVNAEADDDKSWEICMAEQLANSMIFELKLCDFTPDAIKSCKSKKNNFCDVHKVIHDKIINNFRTKNILSQKSL